MSKRVFHDGDEGVELIVKVDKSKKKREAGKGLADTGRDPVHVVYGGADRYSAETPRKLGDIALLAMDTFAPNFVQFATALEIPGSEYLRDLTADQIAKLEREIRRSRSRARSENFPAWFAWSVYNKTVSKLRNEPVEDFRIDFEDGYGFRSDEDEDRHAAGAASELIRSIRSNKNTEFCGFRIKSFAPETYGRAVRTLDLFLAEMSRLSAPEFPRDFCVTLPKVSDGKQVSDLGRRLRKFERGAGLSPRSISIEIMVETPSAIFGKKGNIQLAKLVAAGKGRVRSAHFGAYDYTSSLGILKQGLDHPACDLARQIMLAAFKPLNVRVADSVTTLLPIPLHAGKRLNSRERQANESAVRTGWRTHFANVTRSMTNGFFQSWDLHPNQLPARFAAVYAFYMENMDSQALRLRSFIDRGTKATLSGQTFDDAASANSIMRFFVRGMECGAFNEREVRDSTSLTAVELRSNFSDLAANRR